MILLYYTVVIMTVLSVFALPQNTLYYMHMHNNSRAELVGPSLATWYHVDVIVIVNRIMPPPRCYYRTDEHNKRMNAASKSFDYKLVHYFINNFFPCYLYRSTVNSSDCCYLQKPSVDKLKHTS